MLNDIQITSDYMFRWVALKRRVGAVTSQRVLKVLFYVNILQCFFVVAFSPKYRLSSIICDVASFRLFKPVRSEPLHDNSRKFPHIPFANKVIDVIFLDFAWFSVRQTLKKESGSSHKSEGY
jgi:hypothetical protein